MTYSINSFIDTEKRNSAAASLYFTVIDPIPACLYPLPLERDQTKEIHPTFCCWEYGDSQGNIELSASLGRGAFSPGEAIALKLNVNNETEKDCQIKIDLKRTMKINSSDRIYNPKS